MTRADVREQHLLAADRPSRRPLPMGGYRVRVPPPPSCPRCDAPASGKPGAWWCGECSAPVVVRP